MNSGLRSLLRVAIVVILSAAALFMIAPDILAPWSPWGSFGFDAAPDGRITTIYRNMPADKAGLHVGDRIDVQRASRDVVRVTNPFSVRSPGVTLAFPIAQPNGKQDRPVSLTAVAFPRTSLDNVTDILLILSTTAFILIAAALVLTRPSLLTWAFFIYAVGSSLINSVGIGALSYDWWYWTEATFTALATTGALGFATFALLFPKERATQWRRPILAILVTIAGATLLVRLVYDGARYVTPQSFIHIAGPMKAYFGTYGIVMYLCGVAFFAMNYLTASSSERPRIRWVIVGFVIAFAGHLVSPITQNMPMISMGLPIWMINVFGSLNVLAPITVAYAITKHRVIDVRFFLSRALVYGVLTGAAVVSLVLLEVLVARQLEQYHLALVVEILGALVVGIGIHRAHAVADNLVDRFVFRSIHAAEQHLESIGEAMIYAHSVHAIDEMLRTESMRALDLESVVIVHAPDPDDQLAMRLQASRHPVETNDVLAIPFLVRHQLYGYALFGHHRNGAAIDPNEREILRALSHRAAVAYDHVTSEERASENARLRGELSILQAQYEAVRTLVSHTDQPA